ncbi:hypothetical protein BU17DRAFT_60963 [Hysterangium stoloniferum]|nr:hypothetical protein BU17DRAFT_60963 [Hysterangium stoloniferum]
MDDSEQANIVAKQRMSNFRFRQSPPLPNTTQNPHSSPNIKSLPPPHSHNGSTTSFPPKLSTPDEPSCRDIPNSPSPRSRPTSHHRRRSSVSTRRESAEMMGVAPPPDNDADAGGDPAEVRRLALWALEGGNHSDNIFIGGFTKVEIPELGNFENDPPKPKPSTLSSFGGMGTSLAGKRDSFGKLLLSSSNSLKDQLHTLLEEEEEEEVSSPLEEETSKKEETVEVRKEDPTPSSSFREDSTIVRSAAPQSMRHRPTNLTLRPLSLTPESLPLSRAAETLPTPSLTPSPRIPGLRALTLATSPSPSPSTDSARRQSLSASHFAQPVFLDRRQSVEGYATPPQRKSSISYKRSDTTEQSLVYLPTPDATPTTSLSPLHASLPATLPASSSEPVPDLDRPLSPTEQAFLFRSHTSLLCRISELESAIVGSRNQRFPAGFRNPAHERFESIASTSTMSESESMSSQPSDEMLQLVSVLKAERDELMRDIDGWRTRVGDLEKQIGMLTRRVEAERREGWVVRERLGVVEVEKKRVREDMERERLECRRLEKALRNEERARKQAEEEKDVLKSMAEAERGERESSEREVQNVQREMEKLREHAERVEAELRVALAAARTPVSVRRYDSVDSQMSSSTVADVEEYVPLSMRARKLNAVDEEEEDHDLPQDITSESDVCSESDNDELAHYEDDEEIDDDMVFSDEDHTSSSFGSFARTNSHLLKLDLAAVASAPSTITPSHARTGSMERQWTFSHARKVSSANKVPKVDHFFECLDALDNDGEDDDVSNDVISMPGLDGKLFWRGAMVADDENDDDLPPFVLPSVPSWKDVEAGKLEVVAEEEEEEEFFSPTTPTPKMTRRVLLPVPTPVMKKDSPMTPRTTLDALVKSPQPMTSMIPHRTFTTTLAPPAVSTTTPPSPRAGSMIPRLSISSKTPSTSLSPPPTSTRFTNTASGSPSRIPTPSKKGVTMTTVPDTQPQYAPLFMPQPKVVPRSSVLPPPRAHVLTSPSPPQSAPPASGVSFTARLSQMLGGRDGSAHAPVRIFASKERQLERLRARLTEGDGGMEGCGGCWGGVIDI